MQALVAKAKELLASPDQWNRDNLRELGHLVAGLLPSELRKIGDQVIKDSLQFLKNVDLNLDQVFISIVRILASVTSIRRRRVGRVIHCKLSLILARYKIAGKIDVHHSQSRVGTSQRNLDAPVRGIRGG